MKLPYNNSQQRFLLFYLVLLGALSIASLLFGRSMNSINYSNLIVVFLMAAIYLKRRFTSYGVISGTEISKGFIFRKSIPTDQIERIEMFAGDIKIYGRDTKIVFDKNEIDKSVRTEAEEYFRNWIIQRS